MPKQQIYTREDLVMLPENVRKTDVLFQIEEGRGQSPPPAQPALLSNLKGRGAMLV